ncbi:MAG: hypothetical protein IKV25_07270 [Clostridia bacterium]|nr:hypothetical protein [Clostridia bacterium]
MKKTLAVILALAMVLVMSVSVFAAEKPVDAADTAAWTAYYTELLTETEADPVDVAAEVVADVRNGVVDQDVAMNALEAASFAVGSEAVFAIVKDFLGFTDAPVLPDFLPEDVVSPLEATLGSIFESIFGVIGDLVASLFGDGTSDYCFKTTTTTTTETTTEFVEDVPELGDNSLIAVGAVALVAGAALVLTRKKDAE